MDTDTRIPPCCASRSTWPCISTLPAPGTPITECLALTIHDIDAKNGKLWIRKSKGNKDSMVPIRHYGFCHPAAHKKCERIAFHTGRPLLIGVAAATSAKPPIRPSQVLKGLRRIPEAV